MNVKGTVHRRHNFKCIVHGITGSTTVPFKPLTTILFKIINYFAKNTMIFYRIFYSINIGSLLTTSTVPFQENVSCF